MRKLALLLSALMAFPAGIWADALGLKNIAFDGSLEVLGQQAQNETDFRDSRNDHRGNTITRMRLGMNADLAEDVSGRVEAVRNSDNGNQVQYGDPGRPTSVTTEESLITFQNAYLDLRNFLYTDLVRLGRQYGGRQGDLIAYYGPNNDDAMSVTALDALQVKKRIDRFDALFVTGKVHEAGGVPGSGTETAPGDINVSYFTLSSEELIPSMRVPLEAGYYRAKDEGAA
jgi:hypothetical protein